MSIKFEIIMYNDDINARIALIIKHYNYNKNSFSKAIGLTNNTTIGNIVSGRSTKPSFDVIYKIVSSFDYINRDWLLTGQGEMLKSDQGETKTSQTETRQPGNTDKNKEIEMLKKELVFKDTRIKDLEDKIDLLKRLNAKVEG